MDPISAAASIIGVLGAAGKIATLLYHFTSTIANAPRLAIVVLREVDDAARIIGQLGKYVVGNADIPPAGGSLVMLEQVLVILSNCVATFSELEAILDDLHVEPGLRNVERVKWSLKEPKIKAIVQRLQRHKASLTLMMSVVQCASMQEAERLAQNLQKKVDQLLENDRKLAAWMRRLDQDVLMATHGDDGASTILSTRTFPSGEQHSSSIDAVSIMFAFEEDLYSSQVYQRSQRRHSETSFTTSALSGAAMSSLSKLSLTQVSTASFYALPIYSEALYNYHWYTVEYTGLETTSVRRSESQRTKPRFPGQALKRTIGRVIFPRTFGDSMRQPMACRTYLEEAYLHDPPISPVSESIHLENASDDGKKQDLEVSAHMSVLGRCKNNFRETSVSPFTL
ncbi:MAG: hypothetical protein M1822_002454 [Bathelium mastoideum]|nr:MAG: hypothetical protein M1822_002454 [Bathelium mastoideum]